MIDKSTQTDEVKVSDTDKKLVVKDHHQQFDDGGRAISIGKQNILARTKTI